MNCTAKGIKNKVTQDKLLFTRGGHCEVSLNVCWYTYHNVPFMKCSVHILLYPYPTTHRSQFYLTNTPMFNYEYFNKDGQKLINQIDPTGYGCFMGFLAHKPCILSY